MKKIYAILFLTLLFFGCSNPIKQSEQKKLINNKAITTGISCQDLTDMLGGFYAITYLYLEERKEASSLSNSYLLLTTASKDNNKFFYLCERTRDDYVGTYTAKQHVYDYDLIKIYNDSISMIEDVLYISSEDSRASIYNRMNLADYNLTLDDIRKALIRIEERENEDLLKEIQKVEEKLLEQKQN